MAAEIKRLDPSSTLPGRVLGSSYLKAGVDAANAQNYDEAFKDFDQAAAQGDPEVAVTANTQAAFVVAKMDKPDYKQMQAYADKALALKPNDAAGEFRRRHRADRANGRPSHDDAQKKKAADALNKADRWRRPRATKRSRCRSKRSSKRTSMPHPAGSREAAVKRYQDFSRGRPMGRPHGAQSRRGDSYSGGVVEHRVFRIYGSHAAGRLGHVAAPAHFDRRSGRRHRAALVFFWKQHGDTKGLLRQIGTKVSADDLDGAIEICNEEPRHASADSRVRPAARRKEPRRHHRRALDRADGAPQLARAQSGDHRNDRRHRAVRRTVRNRLGIIRAFQDIALKGNSTPAVVAAGVSEALITTASGLIIAVIAVVFFNYFKSRIKNYNQEMIVAANQLAEMLHFHNTGSPIPTELYQPPRGPPSRAGKARTVGLLSAKQDEEVMAEINITPFTDVLLVLLIIFMILAALVAPPGFEKELPNKNTNNHVDQNKNKNDIEVDVNNKGVIFVDGTKTDETGIYRVMYDASKKKPHHHVAIVADAKAPYGIIIRILDAAKNAGLEDVGFVTS